MKTYEMRLVLQNGHFDIRGNEIVMRCKGCGKHFLVGIGTAAEGMAKKNGCGCSSCGTDTLIPTIKKVA